MSSIPEELYHEILLRLPVKSLLLCKSVCKNWYDLISTSDFVKLHLDLTIRKNEPSLMIKGTPQSSQSSLLFSIGYDSLASSSIVEDNTIDAVYMDYPFKSLGCHVVQFLGSSNGLICMWLFCEGVQMHFFCLWNPATREYREIPESPIESYLCEVLRLFAFGYDDKTDDYKLLVGVEITEDSTEILVYSLASNSWRTGKILPYRFAFDQESGVLFNGELHWVPRGQHNYLLLSLDISDETFKEMQLPKQLLEKSNDPKNNDPYMFLGVLDGCLCILLSSDVDCQFEVWEMRDYGVRESWIKCYVIAHESIIRMQFYVRLVLSFKNGVIVFFNGRGLVLYDLKDGSARELTTNYNPFLHTTSYFESLVTLNSGTYVAD